jgi:hypothetical protein
MPVAFGPWSMGIRAGHYLLLICYRYNVATRIHRCNAHDFGHMWLHYMNHIYSRLQELYGESGYPQHINLSLFEPLKNFVSIGIGPLFFDEAYAKSGEAYDCLSGDLLFLTMWMMVKCRPLPPSSPEEYSKTHGLRFPSSCKRVQSKGKLYDHLSKATVYVKGALQEVEGHQLYQDDGGGNAESVQ